MYADIPNRENREIKQLITFSADTSIQGKTKKLENGSIAHKKKRFLLFVGRGSLKSKLSLSNGCVVLIRSG